MRISEKTVAIVTGGASGLGAGVVRLLRAMGAPTSIFDRDVARGEALSEEVGAHFFPIDVTDRGSIEEGLKASRTHHGAPYILVNCAGVVAGQKIARRDKETGRGLPHDLDLFRKVVEVNLIGTFQMIALCGASMLENEPIGADLERGVIVNTASIAAVEGQMGQAAYSASKGGVLGLTLPVARDLAREGVRCCTVMPGVFKTPMVEGFSEEVQRSLTAQVPFPSRFGEPLEYARLVQQMIENPMLNGTAIRLDGALRMGV